MAKRIATLICGLMIWLTAVAGPVAAQEFLTTAVERDTLNPLITALEDPATRDALIAALKEIDAPETSSVASQTEATTAARIAETSVSVVTQILDQARQIMGDVRALRVLPNVLSAEKWAQIWQEAPALLVTIVVTVLIYRGLRVLSRRVFPRSQTRTETFGTLALHFCVQFALRIASVIVAWVAGYGLSTVVFTGASVAVPQALYLNAFLAFGMFSVLLSTLVSRHADDLTFARIQPQSEAVIYRSVRTLAGTVFYGLIAAVPIVQAWTNFVVARSLRTFIVIACAILAIRAIRRIARTLQQDYGHVGSADPVAQDSEDGLSTHLAANSNVIWNKFWPPFAYLYVAVSFFISIANPNLIAELVGRATVLSALGLVVALIGLRLFRRAADIETVPVSAAMAQLLPTLGARLGGFATPVLVTAGFLCLAAAAILILDGWRVTDIGSWLAANDASLLWRGASLALLLLGLILAWSLMSSYIDKRLSGDPSQGGRSSARTLTLLALFRNTVSIALFVFGGMALLSELGVDIAPLLAGAGVIGLAIGFGAQKLVQDIITGIFIQLENAINTGDVVTVAGVTGGVEKLTIRSVGIRDLNGTYHIVPFSAVDMVGNYMRDFAYHIEIVGVGYDSDMAVVKQAMFTAFDALSAGEHGTSILEPLEYNGVVALADSAINVRARIKTLPGEQWAVGRAYTEALRAALNEAGVEIPFPHRELKLPNEMMTRLTALNSDKVGQGA